MLKGKNIVIIGGTAGIGLAAAESFIKRGAQVVIVGKAGSADQASGIVSSNAILEADATQEDTATKVINLCTSIYGELHGLYHVAGGSGRSMGDGPLHELTTEGWNKTFDLNLTALMHSNQAAIKQFVKQGKGGTILNISSVLAFSPAPTHFSTHAYAAAKSAVIGFSKSVASYYVKDNIRVHLWPHVQLVMKPFNPTSRPNNL
jgi:NAD(P)-dependent dehydrogenase (short-subunit alcohol dehydrogenase family)